MSFLRKINAKIKQQITWSDVEPVIEFFRKKKANSENQGISHPTLYKNFHTLGDKLLEIMRVLGPEAGDQSPFHSTYTNPKKYWFPYQHGHSNQDIKRYLLQRGLIKP